MKRQSAGMITSRSPRSFQLVTNFRSHGGIVKCAHSVITLITRFWPYAIDILPEEKGIVDGIKPVFFSGWDQDNVRYESFLFGTASVHLSTSLWLVNLILQKWTSHRVWRPAMYLGAE
jgi:hypothetical protein